VSEEKQTVDLLIEDGIVVTMDAQRRIYDRGYIAVDGGKIVAVGRKAENPFQGRDRIDAAEMVVLPGIVNAHNHLDQSVYRSCLDENPDSRDVLLAMARRLTRKRAQAAANLTLLEQVQYGITTTHESHWTHYHKDSTDGICEAIRQSGMRAVVARSMNDNEYTPEDFRERYQDVVDDLDRLERAYDSAYIQIISEPTTMLRCTPDAIHAMRDWAMRRRKIWHIHLAQNRAELEDALRTKGMGSVQYAEKLGVLGPEMLAAHCSGLLDAEVELLGARRVRIAHCPDTVARGGDIVPPIWALEQMGATVAIATDGSATNNGQNPWEAMKMAVYLQRVRFGDRNLGRAERALEMATIQAAKALNMENHVGSLEPGKEADLALFRLDQAHLAPDALLVSNLVYSGVSNRADTVMVHGKTIFRNGRSTVYDEPDVLATACEAQTAMVRESGLSNIAGLTRTWPVIH
jgi:5-methylthioadenosine/S-adenosylhomocysteine deaminase